MSDVSKGCATCAHMTPIGARIPSACAGCIVCGECTKWEKKETAE